MCRYYGSLLAITDNQLQPGVKLRLIASHNYVTLARKGSAVALLPGSCGLPINNRPEFGSWFFLSLYIYMHGFSLRCPVAHHRLLHVTGRDSHRES